MDFKPTGAWAMNPDKPRAYLKTQDFHVSSGAKYDMNVYLHGFCTIFALALHEAYGYPVTLICDDDMNPGDDPLTYLTHAYCTWTTPDGNAIYIDVRGMTADRHGFMSEFKGFFDTEPLCVPDFDPGLLKADVMKSIGPERDRLSLEAVAESFIKWHPDWFDVKLIGKTC